MGKKFVFVCGDIGGAKAQFPVARKLIEEGNKVDMVTDGNGMAQSVFREEKMNFLTMFRPAIDEIHRLITGADLVFVNTCASATEIELTFAGYHGFHHEYIEAPLVLGVDGFFNHGFKKWQEVVADYWFAINEAHAHSIRDLRPGLPSERVKVVGQPAFDPIIDLISRKEEIRLTRRSQLGLGDEKTVLWWPTGMGELIEEDIAMVSKAIEYLGNSNTVFMMNGCHPKLENIKKGYVSEIVGRILELCRQNNVRFIDTRPDKMPLEELCLASDVILSVTCTEDIKSTMMGGPPVVHLLGPKIREWMEKELFLKPPYYLPDIFASESLVATCREDIPAVMGQALDPNFAKALRISWQSPKEKATERVARELVALAV